MSEKEVKNIYCPSCKKRKTPIFRLDDLMKMKPLSETRVCDNPKCSLYIDIEKVGGWAKR